MTPSRARAWAAVRGIVSVGSFGRGTRRPADDLGFFLAGDVTSRPDSAVRRAVRPIISSDKTEAQERSGSWYFGIKSVNSSLEAFIIL